MAAMKTRTLEVSIISGENLPTDDRNQPATDMYVAVRTESIKCWSTKMAKQGAEGKSCLWNEKLTVEVPWHAKSITLEVQCKTAKGVVRSIGLARIAIWDLLPKEEGCSSGVLSYSLRNWEGRRSGIINFSVKAVNIDKEQQDTATMLSSCGTFTRIPVCWIHPGIIAV